MENGFKILRKNYCNPEASKCKEEIRSLQTQKFSLNSPAILPFPKAVGK